MSHARCGTSHKVLRVLVWGRTEGTHKLAVPKLLLRICLHTCWEPPRCDSGARFASCTSSPSRQNEGVSPGGCFHVKAPHPSHIQTALVSKLACRNKRSSGIFRAAGLIERNTLSNVVGRAQGRCLGRYFHNTPRISSFCLRERVYTSVVFRFGGSSHSCSAIRWFP